MSLTVASVQLPLEFVSSPQDFFERVREPAERAARRGAKLIAFPDYVGLMLLGALVPSAQGPLDVEAAARAGGYSSTAAMLESAAPILHDFYVHIFSSLAQRLQVHLVPGTVIEDDGSGLHLSAFLFAPDGQIVGSQNQTHRTRQEIGWGIAQGDRLDVFEIGFARVGLVLGADVAYPEVSRILALQGANLLVHTGAYTAWSEQHILVDLWREVQANQVIGLQACGVGGNLHGQSAVYAPVEMTADSRGILAQAESPEKEGIVVATFDWGTLQKVIDDYPIFRYFNYDWYSSKFPGLYTGGRK